VKEGDGASAPVGDGGTPMLGAMARQRSRSVRATLAAGVDGRG